MALEQWSVNHEVPGLEVSEDITNVATNFPRRVRSFRQRATRRLIETSRSIFQSNLTHLPRFEFVPGVGLGIAKCPYDPEDNSTAVWVEKGNPGDLPALYSGTNAEFTKADTVIFRTDLYNMSTGRKEFSFRRTLKYDSKWLESEYWLWLLFPKWNFLRRVMNFLKAWCWCVNGTVDIVIGASRKEKLVGLRSLWKWNIIVVVLIVEQNLHRTLRKNWLLIS